MTDIISAINDDMDEYVSLCEKYGHKVRRDENGNPDCYGVHAGKLERREKEEEDKKKGKEVPIETEVKLRVNEDVICRLEKELGRSWKRTPWERQENIIYRTGESFVRFRREGGDVTLTIKGKRLPGEYNERPEAECELPKHFFDDVLSTGAIGAIVYEKQRASYENLGCEICLDRLGEQYFVEIEGTKDGIQKNIRELRLTEFPLETRDYAQIVQEVQDGK